MVEQLVHRVYLPWLHRRYEVCRRVLSFQGPFWSLGPDSFHGTPAGARPLLLQFSSSLLSCSSHRAHGFIHYLHSTGVIVLAPYRYLCRRTLSFFLFSLSSFLTLPGLAIPDANAEDEQLDGETPTAICVLGFESAFPPVIAVCGAGQSLVPSKVRTPA